MFKTIIVVWLALLVLALYVFTSLTRIIEKRRPTPPSHSAHKNKTISLNTVLTGNSL